MPVQSPARAAAPVGDPPARSPLQHRRDRLAAWGLGLVAALVVVGPGLRPGSWFNLDMVVTPVTPVPRGVWGLGPELPRRVPYALPLAWASSVVDSTWVVKVMVVVSIAAAVAGAWRLATRWYGDLPAAAGAGAGLLYGANPFLLTRLGVGHLPLVVAMGLLPWAAPALFEPCTRLRAMFGWSLAIGLTGFLGGMLALIVVPIGILATPKARRQVVRPLVLVLVSQLPWLVPGVVVLSQGASPAASSDFRTDISGAGGPLRVLAGHGFWQAGAQVGSGEGWLVPVVGVALLVLALAGLQRLPRAVKPAAVGVAFVGLAIPLASALPVIRRVYALLVDSPVSAALREGERILPLYLLVLAPTVAAGATDVARRHPGWREGVLLAAPLALAMLLAGPGAWGINGDLTSVRLPPAWSRVRADVHAGGGTTLSLPFFEYSNLVVADDRDTLDPMPIYLGGDVLSSSNPELDVESEERSDPREKGVERLVAGLRADRRVSTQLADFGIHYVVLVRERDWTSYVALQSDPGFRHVVSSPTIDLYEVRAWKGLAVTAGRGTGAGRAVAVDQPLAPFADISGSAPVRWNRAGLSGWMRGWKPASTTPDGLVALPAGSGPVWYWPALLVLGSDLAVAIAFGLVVLRPGILRSRVAQPIGYERASP